MKIILNQDVYNLGEEGDVCDVANGYARNFLLPKGLAVPCNNANLAIFKSRSAAIEKRKEEKRKSALSLKEKLQETTLTIKMTAGDSGKLFGAVTSQTVVDALAKEGIQVDKKKVDVPSHTIKMVGTYSVLVKLYEKESATVKIDVISDRIEKMEEAAAAVVEEEPAPLSTSDFDEEDEYEDEEVEEVETEIEEEAASADEEVEQ